MAQSEIPEDIDRIATDIVRADYGHDDSNWKMYRTIAQALLSERQAQRERDAWEADEYARAADIVADSESDESKRMASNAQAHMARNIADAIRQQDAS